MAAKTEEKPTGLALLRTPFPDNQISKLPKETGPQAKQRKAAQDAGNWPKKCTVCGGFHHERATHLDYVGHAALTDRLLDCDPKWNWEPVNMEGLPGPGNGMWIKLTVCDVSRLGYGSADGKSGGDAIKEIIGDALRNAAMRFGAALDLWHKGDLHAPDDEGVTTNDTSAKPDDKPKPTGMPDAEWSKLVALAQASGTQPKELMEQFKVDDLKTINQDQYTAAIAFMTDRIARKAKAETDKTLADELGDEIKF